MRLFRALAATTLAAAVALPATAQANHHACPQLTTMSGGNVDVSRKDCSPVYVPYPVGGPKSPLPAGANQDTGLPLPGLQTPYPALAPPEDQPNPPDYLGCYGPDFSPVNKQVLKPLLGTPQNSDPADPYVCPPSFQLVRVSASA